MVRRRDRQLELFAVGAGGRAPAARQGREERQSLQSRRTAEAMARALYEEGAVVGREGLGWRYGTDRNEYGRRVVELDAGELDTLHRIYDLRAEGLSLRQIAGRLASEGRATKRGGRWYASTVRALLGRGCA